jgi:FMN phosphatase YigB (HAD superfamily)
MRKVGYDVDDIVYVGDIEEAEIRPVGRFGLKTVLPDGDEAAQMTSADVVIRNLRSDPREATNRGRLDEDQQVSSL